MSEIKVLTDACIDEIIAIRRDIHRHPETGREEFRTSALIREKLAEIGVDSIESPVPTAVVALIRGAKGPGKCVALRADIDALPVEEDTGLPFSSENPGRMHACGHDIHASMLLGVARVLCGMRESFAGTVKLIFQHSEDLLPGGALELVSKGVLENPKVDAIFGMHVFPDEKIVGKIGVYAGPVTSAADVYNITVTGRGGHSSTPQKTDDPLLAACQTVVLLQQIVSRRLDPMDIGNVSIGFIHGGEAPNAIPGKVSFGGATRAYSEEVRETIRQKIYEITTGMEMVSSCKFDVEHLKGYPPQDNDAVLIGLIKNVVSEELGPDQIYEFERPMTFSEDFSYYGKLGGIPSAFVLLFAGCGPDGVQALHSPKCVFNENAMPCGIRVMAATALAYLKS